MTIREAAEAAGLSRDNIRFYEKEGLLTPARAENGYRNYTEEDVPTPLGHPWRRCFARILDNGLYGLLWLAVQHLLLRWNPPSGLLYTLLDSYIGYGLMLALEPVLLHLWGWTPGKRLLGLEVRDGAGRRPTLGQAFARTCGVFRWGFGWGIPFWSLYRLIRSGIDSTKGELPWDEDALRETLRDERPRRIAATAAAYALVVSLSVAILLQAALLPRHRGELSAAQLAENLNGMLRYHRITDRRVAPDGSWMEPPGDAGTFVIVLGEETAPQFSFETDGTGAVRAVHLVQTYQASAEEEAWPIWAAADYQFAALAAYGFAQPDVHLWTLLAYRRQDGGLGAYFENWETELFGLRARNEVSYEGYEDAGGMLFPIEGRDRRFSLVFTLEKPA